MVKQYPNWDYNLPDLMVRRNQFYAKTDPDTFSIFWTNYQLGVCWNDYINLEL